MHDQYLSKYAISGNEDIWKDELKNISNPGVISIPRLDHFLNANFNLILSFTF